MINQNKPKRFLYRSCYYAAVRYGVARFIVYLHISRIF